jgi:hypothetical protein
MSDREVLERPDDLAMLRAVAAGRVVRGADGGGQTSLFSPHYLDGRLVRLELRRLAAQELINMPISGPPSLAPRGWRLLSAANGEQALGTDD